MSDKLNEKFDKFATEQKVIVEVKIIKNIAQIGPYHLGKEIIEKCRFCETFKKVEHRVYDEFRGKPN